MISPFFRIVSIFLSIDSLVEGFNDDHKNVDWLETPFFRGAIWGVQESAYLFLDDTVSERTPSLRQLSLPEEGRHPICKIGYLMRKNVREYAELGGMFDAQMPRDIIRDYHTIAMLQVPKQENVFLHFYKEVDGDNVVFFTEKIPFKEENLKTVAQEVAPQHFGEVSYGLYTYNSDPTIIVLATHIEQEIGLKTGQLSVRRNNTAGDYLEMAIRLNNDYRKISINRVATTVVIHPVGYANNTAASIEDYFGESAQLRLFQHAGYIYIYPSLSKADEVIFFKAIPDIDSFDPEDSFDSPYGTIKSSIFFSEENPESGTDFVSRDIRYHTESDTRFMVKLFLFGLALLIVVCLVGKFTGIFDSKVVDRRAYFADDVIRKINEKARLKLQGNQQTSESTTTN